MTARSPVRAEALKPCPMCGQPPDRIVRYTRDDWRVWCDRRQADHTLVTVGRTKRAAIAAWNRRTP
jgi:hypothetical protein